MLLPGNYLTGLAYSWNRFPAGTGLVDDSWMPPKGPGETREKDTKDHKLGPCRGGKVRKRILPPDQSTNIQNIKDIYMCQGKANLIGSAGMDALVEGKAVPRFSVFDLMLLVRRRCPDRHTSTGFRDLRIFIRSRS
jgi:hypothetical protein